MKKVYEALKACLKYAVDSGDIIRNPMAIVELPRSSTYAVRTKNIVIPTDEEMKALWYAADQKYKNGKYVFWQNYVRAFRILAMTGMRVGELLALSYSDISFDQGTIKIERSISEVKNRDVEPEGNGMKRIVTDTKTKNGKRVIHVSESTLSLIREMDNDYFNGCQAAVITNEKGKRASYHDLHKTLTRICKSAGIQTFGIHTFRHYFASKCLEKGVEVLPLSKHLGHSSPNITMAVYAHLTERQKGHI